jgi:hypothetical protein
MEFLCIISSPPRLLTTPCIFQLFLLLQFSIKLQTLFVFITHAQVSRAGFYIRDCFQNKWGTGVQNYLHTVYTNLNKIPLELNEVQITTEAKPTPEGAIELACAWSFLTATIDGAERVLQLFRFYCSSPSLSLSL